MICTYMLLNIRMLNSDLSRKIANYLYNFRGELTHRSVMRRRGLQESTGLQYFDLIAKVSPMVNWKELRLVGGKVKGGLFR